MVRKRYKKKTQSGKQTASVPIEEWIERGPAYLAEGRFKEAIDAYKRLLKTETRNEWREGLADAYMGRAGELAGKGMYQEALVFLDHLSALGCQRESGALLTACLLCSGKTEQAMQVYLASGRSLPRQQSDLLQALFAARLIAGGEELLRALPADAPLVKHYGPANEALNAYCAGDDEAAGRLLKTIPYRSPYRDLRTILTALLLRSSDEQATREMFARVDADSPFASVMNVMSVATLSGPQWLEAVSKLGPETKKYAIAAKGIDDKVYGLLSRLQQGSHSAKEFLKLLVAHAKLLDAKIVQPACLDLLPAYPAGSKIYTKQFGQLSDYDEAHIKARVAEQQCDWQNAFRWWRKVLGIVSQDDTEHNRLRSALIARHLADIQKTHFSPYSETIEKFLTFSLELDPDDKPSYLALLEYYQDTDENKHFRQCMDRAVKQFPQDSDILMAAIELALARKTFKKAAGYARTLLQLDPINARARRLLVAAHLSHARKQIKARKFELAHKELNEAETMEREGFSTGIIHIHRGLLAYSQGHAEEGEIRIEEACRQLGSHRTAYVHVVVEAERIDLSARTIKQYHALLKQTASGVPDKAGILAISRVIESYVVEDTGPLDRVLGAVAKYLKKGAGLDYQHEEMAALCSVFEQLGRYDLLVAYATQAVKKWDAPLFVYYRLLAKSSGNLLRLQIGEVEQLKDAMEQAIQRDEADTVKRIRAFLFQIMGFDLEQSFEHFSDEPEFEEGENEDEFDELLESVLNDEQPR